MTIFRSARTRVSDLIRLGVVLAFLTSALIIAGGIAYCLLAGVLIVKSVWAAAVVGYEGDVAIAARHAGLAMLLEGLEVIFVAPMVFLSFLAVSLFAREKMKHAEAALAGRAVDDGASRSLSQLLNQTKTLMASLMVAVLLTNMIARLLGDAHFDTVVVAAHSLTLALCLIYYFLSSRHEEHGESLSGR